MLFRYMEGVDTDDIIHATIESNAFYGQEMDGFYLSKDM